MERVRKMMTVNPDLAVKNGIVELGVELEREIPKIHAFLSSISSEEFAALGEEAEIGKLKSAAKKLVEPGKTLLLHELNDFEKEIEGSKHNLTNRVTIRELLKEMYPQNGNDSGEECLINRRNFIAHAGLEANVTWVVMKGKKVFLTYGECLDRVFVEIGKSI